MIECGDGGGYLLIQLHTVVIFLITFCFDGYFNFNFVMTFGRFYRKILNTHMQLLMVLSIHLQLFIKIGTFT